MLAHGRRKPLSRCAPPGGPCRLGEPISPCDAWVMHHKRFKSSLGLCRVLWTRASADSGLSWFHLRCLQSDHVFPTPVPLPVAWTLSSSVAFWVHWSCVTPWVDPCHMPSLAHNHSSLPECLFPCASEVTCPTSSHNNHLEVPNTCIGGSGAGTLMVFAPALAPPSLCRIISHATRAPKSHIGGSGMTASFLEISFQSSAGGTFCNFVPRYGVFWIFSSSSCEPLHSLRLAFLLRGPARAPKSHIGGSGVTAVQPPEIQCHSLAPIQHMLYQSWQASCLFRSVQGHVAVLPTAVECCPTTISGLLSLLLTLGSVLVPICRSVFVLALLGLFRLLVWSRPTTSWLGSFLCSPFKGRSCDYVLTLARVARPQAVLDWTPHKKPSRPKPRNKRPGSWRVFLGGLLSTLGLPVLPGPFAVSFPSACWILSPTCAAGMAREGRPDVLPERTTTVPVFTPVITDGVSDAWSPCHDPERTVRAEDSLRIGEIPWTAEQIDTCEDSFLGCYVYTPHYSPVSLAVRMPPHADLRYAMDVLIDCAPGVPEGLFNAMVPVHPQRIPGYLSVIRFPAHIRGVHDGYTAVICDLTRIGGSYFATVLPKSLSHEALVAFLAPLAPEADEPLRVFVGCRSRVWPVEALVTLRDGDVITAVRHPEATVLRHRAESLRDRTTWGSMQQFFAPDFHQATYVLHRDSRYRMDTPIPSGIDLFDQIVSELRLDASRIAICSFPLEDFEIHGTRCPLTVAVADVAAPTGGHREPHRQDFFVLCDLRPLGLRPRFIYAHLPRIHLPSLIADLGIAMPAAYQVGIVGARVSGDIVHVGCNCTLLFYAREVETDDSVSITDLSPVLEPSQSEFDSPVLAAPVGVEQPPHTQFVDPTIPEGHGWNFGVPAAQQELTAALPDQVSPSQPSPSAHPDPAPSRAVTWSYESFCTHMADAWEDLGAEEERYIAAMPDNTSAAAALPNVPSVFESGPTSTRDVGTTPGERVSQPGAPSDACSSAIPDTATVIALVFAPDFRPEYLRAHVHFPCGIPQLIAQVAADRYGLLAQHFPKLVPAVPQPYAEFLLFVSAPEWLTERPIVVLDCQRVLRTVRACMLYPSLTRESLLVAAGLRHDSEVAVFVHGLLQPLGSGQRISLITGMVISFTPQDLGAPATFDLANRLQSRDGWDPSPTMPGPGYFPGQTFWVLTDGQPTRFTLGYRDSLCLHAALCAHLGGEEHRLTVVPAQPGVSDAFPQGYWTTNVLVATERISNVPFPPARRQDTGVVLILDCRLLFSGFRWLLLQRSYIPVAEVTRLFEDQCPAEYTITVTGCDAVQQGNDIVFPVHSGQVLVISLSDDMQSSESIDVPPDNPPDPPPDTHSPDGDHREGPDLPPAGHSTASGQDRSRSRSPRGGEHHQLQSSSGPTSATDGAHDRCLVDPNESALETVVLEEQEPSSSSALSFSAARFRVVVPEALSVTLSALCHSRSRLPLALCLAGLQFSIDPSNGDCFRESPSRDSIVVDFRVASAYEAARVAATRLGLPWPLLSPRNSQTAIQGTAHEGHEAPAHSAHLEVTFLVLVPEYSPDSVTMRITIPQTVEDALRHIDACRSATSRGFFPTLYPVCPQPDVRWGLVVAAPSWLSTRVILCLDLTLIDGRIFATVAPPDLDKHILLNLAGLSGAASVDVYLADQTDPVEYGAELLVSNGDCISFVPAQEPLEFRCSLQAMLRVPFGWAGGPAFPQASMGDRFCVVSDGLYLDFLLRPDRAAFYRSDLAARLRVPVHTLCLQPAAPRQCDVTVYGRHCRTVICVSSSSTRTDDEIAILDCRPILEGWSKVVLVGHWLDVGALRRGLSLAAPIGHSVVFSGCCQHWNWLWLDPGQVVVVSYVPSNQEETSCPLITPPFPPEEEDNSDGPPQEGGNHDWRVCDTRGTQPGPISAGSRPNAATEHGAIHKLLPDAFAALVCKACVWLEWLSSKLTARWDLDVADGSKDVKWRLGFPEHANPVGHQVLTPVVLHSAGDSVWVNHTPKDPVRSPSGAEVAASADPTPQSKLLDEPSDAGRSSDLALREARIAARALGVGWPFPPYRWLSSQADDGGDDRITLSEDGDTVTDVVFYLLTPGFIGERVNLPIILPQTVADALDLVQARRSAVRRELFPRLVPVAPQLDLGWGVVLAVPAWIHNRVIVCLDLSRVDSRILSVDVPAGADYHALCECAGLGPEVDVDIYLPGAFAPLPRGVDSHLWTGACVAFVRLGSRRPDAFDLNDMLRTHLGWEHDPAIPRDSLENGYCVVGPNGYCLFRLHADHARHHQADIALLTGIHPERLVLTAALGEVDDVSVNGWECRAVVAATDRQERYDWQEGRSAARVGILDCRAALMGWLVVQTWDDWLMLEPIRRNLDLSAPEGWHVVFPQFPRHWTWTWLQSGQVVIVAYEADASANSLPTAWEGDTLIISDEPDIEPQTRAPALPPAARGSDLPHASNGSLDPRTRPAQTEAGGGNESEVDQHKQHCKLSYQHGVLVKWGPGTNQEACPPGTLCLTPDSYSCDIRCRGLSGMIFAIVNDLFPFETARGHVNDTCKLLQEPARTGTFADRAFDGARNATRMLGMEWPFPPYAWPFEFALDDDSDSQLLAVEEGRLYDLSFYLLTPDYTFEQLDLSVILPQVLWEVLDLIQTCRQPERAAYFPCLIPVVPQPDPGWGILLAVPEWPSHKVFVCCDLSFYDGRIIAVCLPRLVDTHTLCELVGLSPHAEADIYLPYGNVPLRSGEEFELTSGHLVTFLRPGARRHPSFDIHVMLSSHLGWEHSPSFPRERRDNGYCVVGPGGPIFYRMHQERAPFFSADVALLLGLQPLHIELTPAAVHPDDVSIKGWICRTVLAARNSERAPSAEHGVTTPIVGFLDCRPLLGGWVQIITWEGWLDLLPVRAMLQLRAPEGWHVIFPQFPRHWTWTTLTSGQIITVSLAVDPSAGLAHGPEEGLLFGDLTPAPPPRLVSRGLQTPPTAAPSGAPEPRNHHTFTRLVVPRTQSCASDHRTAFLYRTGLFLLFLCLAAALYGELSLALFLSVARGRSGLALYLGVSLMTLHSDGIAAGMHIQPLGLQHGTASGTTPFLADARPRPIATPCRSNISVGLGESSWQTVTRAPLAGTSGGPPRLVTLLEESAEASWEWAFLASTLLDTLVEHFRDGAAASKCSNSVELRLADHLPSARTYDLTALSVDFGEHFLSAFGLTALNSWTIPVQLPSQGLRDEAARLGIREYKFDPRNFAQLHLYTDGSFDGSSSSWAFVVVGSDGEQDYLLGWAGGQVIVDPQHPDHIGADRHSAIAGEQCALIWAIIWALQGPGVKISLFSDCEVALRQANGRYGSAADQVLPAVCRHLFQALEAARPGLISPIKHVRSHTGLPANELVDGIAKFACGEPAASTLVQCPTAGVEWCRSPCLPWLWLAYAQLRQSDLWPTFTGTGLTDHDRLRSEPNLNPPGL